MLVRDAARLAGTVRVREAAGRCAELIRRDRTWTPKAVTAMVCRDLRTVPEPLLPNCLTPRPVCRVPEDPPGGVSLTDAVAAAGRAMPAGGVSTAALVTYLRSLPEGLRLFAAVDDDGMLRGTSVSEFHRPRRIRVFGGMVGQPFGTTTGSIDSTWK